MNGKGKLFITVGFQLINVGKRIKLENHHLAAATLMVVSGKNHLFIIKLLCEYDEKYPCRVLRYLLTRYLLITKEKNANLSWRELVL